MGNKIPFNKIVMDISTAISNEERGNAGDYIILASSPAGANVRIRLNENTAPAIEMHNRYAIKSKNVTEFFVTCDAVAGGEVVFYQSDTIEGFELITPPQAVEEVSSLGPDALVQLDKIINRYDDPTLLIGSSSSNTTVTLLSKALTCDKIELSLNCGLVNVNAIGLITATLDGEPIERIHKANHATYAGEYLSEQRKVTLKSVKGKTLVISGNNTSNNQFFYNLEEYTLKA